MGYKKNDRRITHPPPPQQQQTTSNTACSDSTDSNTHETIVQPHTCTMSYFVLPLRVPYGFTGLGKGKNATIKKRRLQIRPLLGERREEKTLYPRQNGSTSCLPAPRENSSSTAVEYSCCTTAMLHATRPNVLGCYLCPPKHSLSDNTDNWGC